MVLPRGPLYLMGAVRGEENKRGERWGGGGGGGERDTEKEVGEWRGEKNCQETNRGVQS